MDHARHFYIDGKWVDPYGTRTLPVINPATEQEIATIPLGDVLDVDIAVAAARAAFTTYSQTSVEERVALLQRVAEVYGRRAEEIGETISREMGAPRRLAVDVQAAVGPIHLDKAITALQSFRFEHEMGSTLVIREPIGVCA